MNKRKVGLVGAGVVTALVAASPLAWAIGPSAQAPDDCQFSADGGDGVAPDGPDQPLNLVLQAPAQGDNFGIFGQCSTYNNNNGEGNFEDNTYVPPLGLPPVGLPSDGPVNS